MTEFTVADILAARPSLRERAQQAAKLADDIEQKRRHDEEQSLIIDARTWLQENAKCAQAEVEDINFLRNAYDAGGSRRQITWVLDGVSFRAYYEKNEDFAVQVTKSGNSWIKVTNLAEIGAVL